MVDDALQLRAGLAEVGTLRAATSAYRLEEFRKSRTALISRSETWKRSSTSKSTPKISKAFGRTCSPILSAHITEKRSGAHLERRARTDCRLEHLSDRFSHVLLNLRYPLFAQLLALVWPAQDDLVRHALQRTDRDRRCLFAQHARLEASIREVCRQVELACSLGFLVKRRRRIGRRGEEGEERVVDVDGETADGENVDSKVELCPSLVRVGRGVEQQW